VVDVVFGALAQAIPRLVPAAPFGTTGVTTVSGRHPKSEQYYVAVYPYPGGYGASWRTDGLVNGTPPGSMAKFMSIEISEHRYPLRFDYYAIREGSGGDGRHRGGCGTAFSITALSDSVVSILGDRVDHLPFGVQGGHPAAANEVRLVTNGKTWIPPLRSKIEKLAVHAGDSVRLASPGGGGFGNPLERELAAVQTDLNAGIIGPDKALAVYGVVIDTAEPVGDRFYYTVDIAASQSHRAALRRGVACQPS
jgi:N-methylhydantoinase B